MDPNETLRTMREAIARYDNAIKLVDADDAASDVLDAARALDEWLSHGGFLPKAWKDSLSRPGESFRP